MTKPSISDRAFLAEIDYAGGAKRAYKTAQTDRLTSLGLIRWGGQYDGTAYLTRAGELALRL